MVSVGTVVDVEVVNVVDVVVVVVLITTILFKEDTCLLNEGEESKFVSRILPLPTYK